MCCDTLGFEQSRVSFSSWLEGRAFSPLGILLRVREPKKAEAGSCQPASGCRASPRPPRRWSSSVLPDEMMSLPAVRATDRTFEAARRISEPDRLASLYPELLGMYSRFGTDLGARELPSASNNTPGVRAPRPDPRRQRQDAAERAVRGSQKTSHSEAPVVESGPSTPAESTVAVAALATPLLAADGGH
jgi:hypothetical protein